MPIHAGTVLLLALLPLLGSCGSAPKAPSSSNVLAESEKAENQTSRSADVSPAVRPGPPPKPAVVCRLGSDLRKIEVLEVDSGCWLMYHRHGIKKRIAWSEHGNAHCEVKRDNVRSNLEDAGYECKWDQ